MGHVRGVSTERGSDGGIANGQVKKLQICFWATLGNMGKCLGTLLWTSPSLLRASQRKVTLKNRKEKIHESFPGAAVCWQPRLSFPGRFSEGAPSGSSHPGALICSMQCTNCFILG